MIYLQFPIFICLAVCCNSLKYNFTTIVDERTIRKSNAVNKLQTNISGKTIDTNFIILKKDFGLLNVINSLENITTNSVDVNTHLTAYLERKSNYVVSEVALTKSMQFKVIQTGDCDKV